MCEGVWRCVWRGWSKNGWGPTAYSDRNLYRLLFSREVWSPCPPIDPPVERLQICAYTGVLVLITKNKSQTLHRPHTEIMNVGEDSGHDT